MRRKRNDDPGGVVERDAALIGTARGVGDGLAQLFQIALLALERDLGVGVGALLVLAQSGLAGYTAAIIGWLVLRGAGMPRRRWVVVAWTPPALSLQAAGVSWSS
jgi:hypothetical protein